ncbi:integrase [Mycobacterium phage Backyardigan]|uniref:Serine integrase n=2 Tax=Backyardiganvirus TaxID=2946815 RepID=G1BL06_9CAUD|nr:integrase [Mycobacterium phage Backyardigan]AEJ94570.1 serine integrase [Mycobacterium phage Backyardigan]WAB09360.1 serine integrase [Mycobacterium phage Perplexer]
METMPQPLRALVGARVSVVQGPQKVSQQAQLETARKWAEAQGHEIVGTFEDLGVSASVRPDDRPDLGKWLTDEGASKWDVIVWSKMDRAFRSTKHCVDFAQWAEERQKVVMFAEDNLRLDYRPGAAKGIDAMMAELFVYLGSFFAQLELNRFKSRAQDSHRVLRQTDRWASGLPPLGYKTVPHPSGKGFGLDTDEDTKAVLYDMAGKLLDGWSLIGIAKDLNDRGVLGSRSRARLAKGKPIDQAPWNVSTVKDALTNLKTQGIKMTGKGKHAKPVLDAKGEQIVLAPPTFDWDTWKQIQDAVALREQAPRSRVHTKNPMLGIGICGKCGATLAQQHSRKKSDKSVVYRYYRCSRTPVNCDGVFIVADEADTLLEEAFLYEWADQPVTRRVFVPGEDHTYELEQINETIARLRRESDAGLIVSDEDERIYLERMRSLITRRTKLEAMPRRSAGWVEETTGQTYGEAWETEDHQQLLKDAKVKFILYSNKPRNIEVVVPQDRVAVDLAI